VVAFSKHDIRRIWKLQWILGERVSFLLLEKGDTCKTIVELILIGVDIWSV